MWEEADLMDVKKMIGIYSNEENIGPHLNKEEVLSMRRAKLLSESEMKDNMGQNQRLLNVFEIPNTANKVSIYFTNIL